MNPNTYGQCYNATRDRIFTWLDYFQEAGAALGKKPQIIFMPAAWIIAQDPGRFSLLREISQFHGAYTSEKSALRCPGIQLRNRVHPRPTKPSPTWAPAKRLEKKRG